MTPTDRAARLAAIRERLFSQRTCNLVTSLQDAHVDLTWLLGEVERLTRTERGVVRDIIAALRQAWQERDIEAKAALACNDALVRERAALAAAQAERDALRQRFDTFRATRNREQDSYVQANHEFAAALTEARRALAACQTGMRVLETVLSTQGLQGAVVARGLLEKIDAVMERP